MQSVCNSGITYRCHTAGRAAADRAAILLLLIYVCIRKGRSLAQLLPSNWAGAVAGSVSEMFLTLSCPTEETQITRAAEMELRVRTHKLTRQMWNAMEGAASLSWREGNGCCEPTSSCRGLPHVFVCPFHSHTNSDPFPTTIVVCPCQTPAQRGQELAALPFFWQFPFFSILEWLFPLFPL